MLLGFPAFQRVLLVLSSHFLLYNPLPQIRCGLKFFPRQGATLESVERGTEYNLDTLNLGLNCVTRTQAGFKITRVNPLGDLGLTEKSGSCTPKAEGCD
jgi:hypothetical protein